MAPQRSDDSLQQCPICLHGYARGDITRHHLVPRSRRGRETVTICRHCHKQIHVLFTEKELERSCATIEELLAAPAMRKWTDWIRKRKPTSRLRTRQSRNKGRH